MVATPDIHSRTPESVFRRDGRELRHWPARAHLVPVLPFSSRAGPIGEPVELKCTIPAGKTIFLAVLPFICTPFLGETIEEAVQFCKETIDLVDLRRLRINGVARNDLIERRVATRAFALPTPDDNLFGDPTGIFKAVHEGYFAVLPPLEPGHHTIRVQAALSTIGIEFDTRYRLHIVKPVNIPRVP